MNYMERALDVLRQAEGALRDTIAEAMSVQEYKQLAGIAALADAVASLVRANAVSGAGATLPTPLPEHAATQAISDDGQAPAPRQPSPAIGNAGARQTVEPPRRSAPPRRQTRRAKPGYSTKEPPARKPDDLPHFLREADRLVKIGWSERDHNVYEHRAPRSTVFEFARLAHDRASETAAFTMDDVLPVKDQTGKDTPSYHAYLALAWLRAVGAIQRVGKDGYTAKKENLEPEALDRLWSALDARGARPILEQSL
jgi:hypothetical protein